MITTEQLQQFCDTENTLYWLARPWRHGGRIYATDARILVSIPDDSRELPTPDRKIVDAKTYIRTDADYAHVWPPLDRRTKPCASCGGSGKVLVSQTIAGRRFIGYYCEMILSLGSVKYAAPANHRIWFHVPDEDLYGVLAMMVDERTEAAPCTDATGNA